MGKTERILPIVLVSDREEWLRELRASCRGVGVIPEDESWSSAATRRWPLAALVLDLTVPFEPRRALLTKWTRRGWQPVCALCISPERGAAELDAWVRSQGCLWIFHGVHPSEYGDDLERSLHDIIERRLWLVVEFAKALDCRNRDVIHALSVAMTLIPAHKTVESWRKELGLRRRQDLAELLSRAGLPRPKRMLRLLRLARVLEYATMRATPVARTELARRFGYADVKYLRREARALTSQALDRLIAGGLDFFFRLVAEMR